MRNDLSVEEALRLMLEKAAMLRYLTAASGCVGFIPEKPVLDGISDVCEEVEELAERTMATLKGTHTLSLPLKKRKT